MSESSAFAIVEGALVPASRAAIRINDLSIQRGYGVFDFFKTLDHTPIFLDEHLERFYTSAAGLRLSVGGSPSGLRALIRELQEKNNLPDSGIRLTLTGGYSPDGYNLAPPNLIISQSPLTAPITREFQKSIRLITFPHRRQMPEIKTIDYLMAIWLQPVIREKGADDVIYHHEGIISECPRSNFFIVTKDDILVTPSRYILKGVIRGKVLELARRRIKVEERDIRVEELGEAKEAFVTSTTKHILPVTDIDDCPVGVAPASAWVISRWLNEELYKMVYHLHE